MVFYQYIGHFSACCHSLWAKLTRDQQCQWRIYVAVRLCQLDCSSKASGLGLGIVQFCHRTMAEYCGTTTTHCSKIKCHNGQSKPARRLSCTLNLISLSLSLILQLLTMTKPPLQLLKPWIGIMPALNTRKTMLWVTPYRLRRIVSLLLLSF